MVGHSVWNFARGVFEGREQVFEVNDTLIVLNPKVDIPKVLNNFHPISLCNVGYKVMTKLIANRLQNYMPELVSLNQVNLVPGRHILDNIIIVQELVHMM